MFDRWEWEKKISDCFDPYKLFLLAEELAALKLNGYVPEAFYDELSSSIIEKIHGIEEVRSQVTAGKACRIADKTV
jgi:hypothetical protein